MREGGPRVGTSFLSAGAVLALTLAAGRLSGLLREMQLAASFGVTPDGDLAVILLTLPDLLVNVLLAGGLSAALVPRLRALPALEAARLFKSTLIGVAAFFAAVAAAIVAWPSATFAILAPGLATIDADVHRRALAAVAVAIPLTAITGVTTAYLNAHQRFFVAGCGTLIFNLCVIGALLLANGSVGLALTLALGIGAGAMVRAASQVVALPHSAWERRARPGRLEGPFVRAFVAATGAASLMLLVPIVVRALASLTGSGSIASFNYATKLVEVPVGILISAAGTVALARLSERHACGDGAGARELTRADLQRDSPAVARRPRAGAALRRCRGGRASRPRPDERRGARPGHRADPGRARRPAVRGHRRDRRRQPERAGAQCRYAARDPLGGRRAAAVRASRRASAVRTLPDARGRGFPGRSQHDLVASGRHPHARACGLARSYNAGSGGSDRRTDRPGRGARPNPLDRKPLDPTRVRHDDVRSGRGPAALGLARDPPAVEPPDDR